MTNARRATDVGPFPQYRGHFHKKIGVTTDDFQADHEYLTNQRRRNLPVGESRQGPSGEPATGLAKHSRNWLLMDGTKKALTANVMTEKYGKRGLRSQVPNSSEVAISCDLAPNRVFEKSESRGEVSKEKSPLRFYELVVYPKIPFANYDAKFGSSVSRIVSELRMGLWPTHRDEYRVEP